MILFYKTEGLLIVLTDIAMIEQRVNYYLVTLSGGHSFDLSSREGAELLEMFDNLNAYAQFVAPDVRPKTMGMSLPEHI